MNHTKNILQADNCEQQLRSPTRELTQEEIISPEIQSLIQTMKQMMHDAPGVGLAAPQIGEAIKLAVIEDREMLWKNLTNEVLLDRQRIKVPFHVIINPVIIEHSDKINIFFEGCLSVKGKVRLTPRYDQVTVACLDEQGNSKSIKASGWYARILQHEIDHLNGRLYIDLASEKTEFNINEEFMMKFGLMLSPELEKIYHDDK